jgi:hypothetical protein
MMRHRVLTVVALAAAALAVAASASASMMHPRLAARLSGMGEHGTVNLEFTQGSGQVCWLFELPMVRDVTGTVVHAGLRGATLFELGMHYARSGCERVSKMAVEHLEAKPGSYSVWVNTKGHPGDLRGRLYRGMAHM